MSTLYHLTKTRYTQGLQCKKSLWLSINRPELAAPPDDYTQRLFSAGTKIGALTRTLFPGGILIEEDHQHLNDAMQSTSNAVSSSTPSIFEATALQNRILCRADILNRNKQENSAWDIIEVKSSTSVETMHYHDIAIQKHCFELAGYRINKTYLMYINNEYIRNGPLDVRQLMKAEDVTTEVFACMANIGDRAAELLSTIDNLECPTTAAGKQCTNPHKCTFYSFCHATPPEYSIYEISGSKSPVKKLEQMGIQLLQDVPDDFKMTKRLAAQVLSVKRKEPVIDRDGIKKYLEKLIYPIYHFDYETISSPIPFFDTTRPYQAVPFQFSLHIQKQPLGKCEHFEFLMKDSDDPRERLIITMLSLLGTSGSIIAFNAPFEMSRIKELAIDFSQYSEKLHALIPRFWDLIKPFRSGDYAHYDFHGSASLKQVLPVLVPSLSYKTLEIQGGGTASLKAEQWYSGQMGVEEWDVTYGHLLKYCHLDTLAMVELLRVLYEAVST